MAPDITISAVFYLSIALTSGTDPSTAPVSGEERTQVAASPGPISPGYFMPEKLDLSFGMSSGRVNLNLTLNDHVTSDVPVFEGIDGNISIYTDHGKNDFAVYTDLSNHAGFLVETYEEDGQQIQSYRGSFRVGYDEYVLEPRNSSGSRRRRSTDLNDHDYVVYKRELSPGEKDFTSDSVMRPENRIAGLHMDEYIGASAYYPGRQVYDVELFLFVDYAIFNSWVQRSRAYYYETRKREAIDNIRFYFSQVVNGIDMRYQSIDEADFAIYVRLKGFFIATSPDDSPWTSRYPNIEYGRNRHYTHAERALDSFEKWLNESASKLPTFDQATLFTGNILYNGLRADRSRRTISGLADIKGICSFFKASVNLDAGLYASIQTAAHELGHSLGAEHDNSAYNWCVSRDQYIMATSPGELNDRNFQNPFKFSVCSRYSFRRFLFYLTVTGQNCLQASNGNPDIRIRSGRDDLAGRRYDLDEQCKIKNGPRSYYCGGHVNDQNICKRVMCFIPEMNRCDDPVEQRAYDGTNCGNRKWCDAGECVYRSAAPSTKEFCMSGDFLGRLDNGEKCMDVIRREAWQCYESPRRYHEHCCESCQKIKDETNPGCEYGDRSDKYCRNVRSKPWTCYESYTQKRCCASCAEIARRKIDTTLPENCEYGDKARFCSTIRKSNCYGDHKICCESCQRMAEKSEECRWGNMVNWCSSRADATCYTQSKQCCGTCKPWGPSGCEFGDKEPRCSTDSYYRSKCTDPYYRDMCCRTCGTFSNTPRDCQDDGDWCRRRRPWECYDASIRRSCCRMCALQKIGPPGCEYGDRVSWCSARYCDTEKTRCCHTCR